MASSDRDNKMLLVRLATAAALGLGAVTTGCTPATPDGPTAPADTGKDGSAASSGNVGSSGSVGSSGVGSGGTVGSSGVGSSGNVGSSGVASSGNVGSSGSGGSTAGSASGSSGSGGSGSAGAPDGGVPASVDASAGEGGGAATGCNWIQNTDGTLQFNPAAPNKVVLFDGSSLSNWHKLNQPNVPVQWTLNADGTMTVVPSGTGQATQVQSNMKFDDLCVHVEYMTPHYPSNVVGQLRGNSGVYLKSAYEMQILDSYGQPPDINTCGAVYSIMKPLVVACHMELVWNTYEIEFKSSVWNNATPPAKTKNAEYVKCALNGVVVQQNVQLNPAAGYTQAGIPDAPGPQPLGLQDHLDLVSFRNIWVRVPQY